jgi:hypothetical protein
MLNIFYLIVLHHDNYVHMEYGHIFDLSLIIKCYVLYIENGEADCYSTLEFRVYNLSFFHVINLYLA